MLSQGDDPALDVEASDGEAVSDSGLFLRYTRSISILADAVAIGAAKSTGKLFLTISHYPVARTDLVSRENQ